MAIETNEVWYADDGDIAFVHGGSDEAAVGALLGLPVTTPGERLPVPGEVAAHLILDSRPPHVRAVEVCRHLLEKTFPGWPVELQTAQRRIPTPALMVEQTQPGKRAWFARIIPDERHLCLQALGRPAGGDVWEKLSPPRWLDYPRSWDGPAVETFAVDVRAAVGEALETVREAKARHVRAHQAEQLPGIRTP